MSTSLAQVLTYEPYYTIAYPCQPAGRSSDPNQSTTVKPPPWTQWTQAQEKMLSNDYPFEIHATDPEDYLYRSYLQWLWLPESIMPLKLFVRALRHLQIPGPSSELTEPHPLHTFLEPILLTTRRTSSKYHTELLRVLVGGFNEEADMEEAMMWFAAGYEPHNSSKGKEKEKEMMEEDDGPWKDSAWRDNYMRKMERRETLIQILLYMFKLSLPGPAPVDPSSTQPKKRKRSPSRGRKSSRKWSPSRVLDEPVLTAEDHLESFMDKLSMWQLMGNLESHSISEPVDTLSGGFVNGTSATSSSTHKEDKPRDWAQKFAEDIVEKEYVFKHFSSLENHLVSYRFKDKLPELCALLRSKVFPVSVFSEEELTEPEVNPPKPAKAAPASERPPKPSLSRQPSMSLQKQPGINGNPRALSRAPSNASLASHRALSRAPSRSRVPSPLPFDNDVQMADDTSSQVPTKSASSLPAGRTRSLSLSQSLAQEQRDRERGTTLHAPSNARKRAVLTREISMSRSFKRKASGILGESQGDGVTAVKRDTKEKQEAIAREKEKERKKRELEVGVTLVEETPVKRPRLEPTRPEREQNSATLKPLKALDLSAAMPRPAGAAESSSRLQLPVQTTSRSLTKSKSPSPAKSPSPSPPHSPSPPARQSRSRDISPDIFLPPSSPPSQTSSQPPTQDLFSGNESPLTDYSSSEDEEVPLQKAATNKALSRVKTKSFKGTVPDDDDDDEWTIQSSPDISLLNPKTGKSTKITSLKLLGPRPSPLKGKSTTASELMDVDREDDEEEVETQIAGDGTTTEAELSADSATTSKSKTKGKPKRGGATYTTKRKGGKSQDGGDTEKRKSRTPSLLDAQSQGSSSRNPSPSLRVEVVITSPKKPTAKRGKRK
ncbi:hypothetical protein CVT24_011045 [Panaeolus cyanescens]|uniref:DNA replication regulator Sld3 C-terminal domain-containing protein n=1 Tax=Panaeolus cyanescens TaxID=181874 RepID=A0A409VFX5_9AGAR|nr:hypothetical protein CVT24_011045 [Panaeolus cyanescens]